MKKLLAALTAVLLCSGFAFGIEYGGMLDNTATFKESANKWDKMRINDATTLSANLRQSFNDDGTFYFATEGFIRYNFATSLGSSDMQHQFIADLSLLKIGASIKMGSSSSLILSVGRFLTTDATQIVFAQPLDGIQAQFRLSRVNIQAMAGYTGLLNKKTTALMNAEGTIYGSDSSKILYELSAPYVVAEAAISLPYILFNQTVALEVMGAFGIGDEAQFGNRMYASLILNGPLAKSLFYRLSTTFETTDFSTLANATNFMLAFYPNFKSTQLALSATYASADNEGGLSKFTGITALGAVQGATVLSYSSIFKAGLSGSIKPVNNLLLGLGVDAVFNSGDFSYSGLQISGNAKYQLFSDIGFVLNASTYIAQEVAKSATTITLKATISF